MPYKYNIYGYRVLICSVIVYQLYILWTCIQSYYLFAWEGDDKEVVPKFVQLPAIQDGNVDLLYAQPEALFTGKAMSKILRSDKYQKRLGAIVVDEIHIVTQW